MRVIKANSQEAREVQIISLSEFRLHQFKRDQAKREAEKPAVIEMEGLETVLKAKKPTESPRAPSKVDKPPKVDPFFRPFGAGKPGKDYVEAKEPPMGELIHVDFKARVVKS